MRTIPALSLDVYFLVNPHCSHVWGLWEGDRYMGWIEHAPTPVSGIRIEKIYRNLNCGFCLFENNA